MADRKPKATEEAGAAAEPPQKAGLKTKVAVGVGATLIGLGTGAVIADQTRGESTEPARQAGAVSIDQAPTVEGPPQSIRVFAGPLRRRVLASAVGQRSRRVVRRQRPGDGPGDRVDRSRHRFGGGGAQSASPADTDPDKQVM